MGNPEAQSSEDKIWCSVEATFNLGNYENIKLATGLSRTLPLDVNEYDLRNSMMSEMIDEVLDMGNTVRGEIKKAKNPRWRQDNE